MIDFLWNTASFIVALGVLVSIHEYGHFWVARKLGVKVLRFSVGFGKALWSRTAADGTEYVIAAIPLGGYVKMLDEREGNVAPEDLPQAFNTQPVTSRIAIVAAGPVANFLLAILVYWWMFVLGVPALKPNLGEIPPQSIAAEAGLRSGDEIVSIDGKAVTNRDEVNMAIVRRMGETSHISIGVRHIDDSIVREYDLQLQDWQVDPMRPDVLGSLGIVFWTPVFPAELGEIVPGQAAAQAGLQKADRIISINQQSVDDWYDVVDIISDLPDTELQLLIERDSTPIEIRVKTGSRIQDGKTFGYLGVGRPELPESELTRLESTRYRHQYGFFEAIGEGINKTWEITLLTFRFIGKIFTGEVSPKSLSGPITIAQGVGAYASYGFVFFLNFLGMISVNLGIINLLPIPVLDGGHLLYYTIELFRGKPLSEAFQEMGYRIGLLLVLSLMVFTIINDISRL